MVRELREIMYDYFVCPDCHLDLVADEGTKERGYTNNGLLSCVSCTSRFPVREGIPSFLSEKTRELEHEGVAVDLDNAVALFRREIDPEIRSSGRLFDQDVKSTDASFLDVGCGIGRHLLVLRNNGSQNMLGFDVMPELVSIARNDYDLSNVFVANASRIPIRSESIDICLLYNVIEHCSDPEKVLEEIRRVLKKDGTLYMDVPNARSMGDRIFRWGGITIYGKTSHIQTFTLKKFRKLLQNSGFEIAERKTARGIFIDYPQLERFGWLRKIVTFLFGNEVSGWEFKLRKTH
jgi:ubiquinone/menaquinone biosynthesis C-methylase UbiE